MTRDDQLKTLKSTKASKEQLRQALAASLGVEYEPQKQAAKEVSIFTQCQRIFMRAYKDQTKIDYSFGAIDGRSLKSILTKIGKMTNDDNIVITFQAFINKLPDWYRQNAFSLKIIDNKFNEIVASIKNNGSQQTINDDYIASVLRDLAT